VDFAPRAIRLAKQKLNSSGTKANLRVSDATDLRGVNGPFEFALDIGCFHSIHKVGKAKYLKELHRILAPNGLWLMYGFLKSDSLHAGTGLDLADLDLVSSSLTLVSRRDGIDDKRDRKSAWFLYQKQ
jgi:ubiquinone/menaquinone biosynthesis C-methylase UbiE